MDLYANSFTPFIDAHLRFPLLGGEGGGRHRVYIQAIGWEQWEQDEEQMHLILYIQYNKI